LARRFGGQRSHTTIEFGCAASEQQKNPTRKIDVWGTLRKLLRKYSLFFPRAQDATYEDRLACVIGAVIRDEQSLGKNGLASAVRNLGIEIRIGIEDQFTHLQEFALNFGDAFVPGFLARRRFGGRPIAGREVWRDVLSVAAEFEDVPLRDADVFEKLPECVRDSGESLQPA
jgi:hypothetical protein